MSETLLTHTKPKSRAEKNKSQSIQLTVAITKNFNNAQIANLIRSFLVICRTLTLQNMVRKYAW